MVSVSKEGKLLRLALAEKACLVCGGTGIYHAKDFPQDEPGDVGTNSFCEPCKGTGRVMRDPKRIPDDIRLTRQDNGK